MSVLSAECLQRCRINLDRFAGGSGVDSAFIDVDDEDELEINPS